MNCNACGFSIPEGASFCPNCGTRQAEPAVQPVASGVEQPAAVIPAAAPTVQPVSQPAVQPAVQSQAQQPYGAQPVAQPGQPYAAGSQQVPSDVQQPFAQPQMPQGSAQGGYQPQATPQGYGQTAPQGGFQSQPVYAKGCVSAALDDIKGQQGVGKKMAFLGLLGCVPILNFVVTGYAINWSREVPFGAKSPMPKKVVNGQNFEIGFYCFLLSLVVGLVVGLVAGLLALIPLLGWIAAIVIAFGASMYQYLAYMRMGMLQQLGEGFKIQLIWQVMQRDWKSLLCAALVPSLVAGLIASAAVLVVSLLVAGTGAGATLMLDGGAGGGIVAGLLALVSALLVLVAYAIAFAASAVAVVVTMRAMGHWVARYAPEWTNEAWAASRYQQAPPQNPMV